MVTARRIRPTAGQDEEQPPYRILPHNLEAEQGLLGVLMVDNSTLEQVSEFLRPFHFHIPVHQRLYPACRTFLSSLGQFLGALSRYDRNPVESPHQQRRVRWNNRPLTVAKSWII
jgi:DnaB-like helicase N terminal domain